MSPCIGSDTGKLCKIRLFENNVHITVGCTREVDEVWNILWPFSPVGTRVNLSCGVNFIGTVATIHFPNAVDSYVCCIHQVEPHVSVSLI